MTAPRRPRRRIEIYFVLYLVALVLLLPDKNTSDGLRPASDVLKELRLDMQPERVRLECVLIRDSAGSFRLRSLDSMNVIRYTGEVADIHVRARIEDVETGQILTIEEGDNSTRLFTLAHQPERQAVLFRWNPDITSVTPRTFRVTVYGSAAPPGVRGPNSGDGDIIPAGLRINGSTQFVLTTTIEGEGPQTIITMNMPRDTVIMGQGAGSTDLGQFFLAASREEIPTLPSADWTNRITFGGANPLRDLAAMPEVRVSGSVVSVERYLDTAQRALIIRGKAPRSGISTVTVTARRRDGAQAQETFTISSVPLQSVSVPSDIYPGVTVTIDPRLPDLPDVRATIRLGDDEIATVRGGTLKFTADRRDTGKTYVFERFVEGQRAGAPVNIRVRNFPAPEIQDVRDFGSGDKKKVIVKFYGDGRTDRPLLDVVEGNAQPPKKQYGNLHAADGNERPTITWLEEFIVERKDPSRPFTFKLRARDPRGMVSKVWTED